MAANFVSRFWLFAVSFLKYFVLKAAWKLYHALFFLILLKERFAYGCVLSVYLLCKLFEELVKYLFGLVIAHLRIGAFKHV